MLQRLRALGEVFAPSYVHPVWWITSYFSIVLIIKFRVQRPPGLYTDICMLFYASFGAFLTRGPQWAINFALPSQHTLIFVRKSIIYISIYRRLQPCLVTFLAIIPLAKVTIALSIIIVLCWAHDSSSHLQLTSCQYGSAKLWQVSLMQPWFVHYPLFYDCSITTEKYREMR